MTKAMKKVSHAGQIWCTVEDGSHYLKTNTNKMRALMGAGQLAYTQIRKNGRLYVLVADLLKIKYPPKADAPATGEPLSPEQWKQAASIGIQLAQLDVDWKLRQRVLAAIQQQGPSEGPARSSESPKQ